MNFNVLYTSTFKKEAKKLVKKYPSLKDELGDLIETLETDPEQGTSLGKNCFKIRVAIKSKGKGKSGGARIITNVKIEGSEVYLLSIYDKGEKEDITKKEFEKLLNSIDLKN